MSISNQSHEQPLNSQCEYSSPQPHPSGDSLHRHSPHLAHHVPDFTCKVSPFKPKTSKPQRLPVPKLTPIPLHDEDDKIFNSLGSPKPSNPVLQSSNTRHVFHSSSIPIEKHMPPPIVGQSKPHQLQPLSVHQIATPPPAPFDIDVPSPPSLSSSDEHPTEKDATETDDPNQSTVKTATEMESSCIQPSSSARQIQVSECKSPQTDTCDPPEFSQDSAFFSFPNVQTEVYNGRVDSTLRSQEATESLSAQQDIARQSQAHKRYYMRAFDYVIEEVLKRYCLILPSQDVHIATIFRDNLSENAQALFVRMYGRKQPQWYRVSKLEQAYASEINVRDGIDELCRERFLISSMYALKGSPKSASLLARELLSTLSLSEMRTACASIVDGSALRRLPRNSLLPSLRKLLSKSYPSRRSKKRLMQTTLSGLRPADCLARAVLKLAGHSIRMPDFILSGLKRMRFLFFLDDGHDSPNVILADTGKVKFPVYKCQPRRAVFTSSQALEDYESAVELEQWIDESLEGKEWSRAAYFGSIAELEVREFLNFCEAEAEEGGRLSSPTNSPVRLECRSSSLEKRISSRRPALRQRANRKEQLEQLNHPFLRRYTAQWVFVRSCWHSVLALERLSEYKSAVNRLRLLLSTSLMPKRRGKCLTRLTINLFKHLGELEEPLQIIVSALSSPENNLHLGDQIGLAQRGAAIHAKLTSTSVSRERRDFLSSKAGSDAQDKPDSGHPRVIVETLERIATQVPVRKILGKSLNVQSKEEKDRISSIEDPWLRYIEEFRSGPQLQRLGTNLPIMGKSVFMSHQRTSDRVSVEEYCLEWYSGKEGMTGAHDEGKSIRFLFTLFLWECGLFAEVPDVFQTPYQDRPLDLYTEAFYPSRKENIDLRLEEIVLMSSDEIYSETLDRYRQFEGTRAVGCVWTSYSSEDIAKVAAGLGGAALAHCCGLLAKDYMYWGGGLPDLTLWRVDEDSGRQHYKTKLVEVKSARDSLSERQRAWLLELQSCGVDCEVCKVVEKVSPRNAREIEDTTLTRVSINNLYTSRGPS